MTGLTVAGRTDVGFSRFQNHYPGAGIALWYTEISSDPPNFLVMQRNPNDTPMMRTIKRSRPNSDITVTAFASNHDDEHLVRVAGFNSTDYLTTTEAHRLARALDAAADEVDAFFGTVDDSPD
jgi:hypothetical protein